MQILRSFGTACVLAIEVSACSSNALTSVTVGFASETQGSHTSALRGWVSPDGKKTKTLLYVSESESAYTSATGLVDVFSVPKYSLVGQITNGIDHPQGLAVDKKGNLYVANNYANTVTVYPPGETSPSLTLNEPDFPLDVAVRNNGYVYVGDDRGGVDVYPPGATSPSWRLTNPSIARVAGVAVSLSGNVYADGESPLSTGSCCYTPAVVEFANGRGSGKNLGLKGLVGKLAGVIVDDDYLIVTDFGSNGILIYPPGRKSPSSTISVFYPIRPATN